ncbi:MAG: ATP-binding protein [Beduini sp.]|uniref:ATP-binding protein n=1 Tax=Beduini sp. TaxID=1922300 RepID=UPI00399F6344
MIKHYDVMKDDYENAGKVSSDIKRTLKQLGLDTKTLRNVAIAAYEAEINMIIHSLGGAITFELSDEGEVILCFDDIGPGIPNLDLALQPGWSTASAKARELGFGAGMGLVNMKRVANNFHIESSPQGTHLKMRFSS